jgi:alanine racemase
MWVPHWSGEALEAFPDHVAGPDAQRIEVTCFQSLDDLVDAARTLDEANVLVKVASHERLGAAVQALAPARHVTTLTLNVSALVDNVRVLRSHVGAKGVIAVIKGLGYGTDPVVLGRLLEAQGVDWLAVAYADEGVVLREAGITSRILVLNPDPGTFDTLLEHRLEPQLVSLEHLELAHGWAISHGIAGWPVHLKLDTGMHRLGLAPHEDRRAEELLGSQELSLATVMTHLAGADDPALDERTRGQLAQFHERTQAHFPDVPAHVLNSAGAARVHEIVGDNTEAWAPLLSHIRVGLAMYGLGPGALELGLQPVLSLETSVAKLVHVPARHGSGYGWTDAATHDRVLAVLSVGYADGYPRNLGNGQGKVLWKGRLLPTVGRVCMDMTTVDATGLDVQPGDRVTLWGEAPRLDDLALHAKTIPYELLTRLGPRVQRVIVR